ncbi:tripartite tricarboxylate transporter permease [Sulfitobacter sp. S190]|nr:tripartite tricarboxylate transporter permease [Sulfitobacter sp. S190]
MLDHLLAGIAAVLGGPDLMPAIGLGISSSVIMVAAGFLIGIVAGSVPGLAGPAVMAISLPILITVFGYTDAALLPVLGFLIGVMKGATVGGAVPAILFNTPGTPDAYLTARDGYPMARRGDAGTALRVAHFSSACGDTFSDVVLIVTAPFLALAVERLLDLPEKTALLLLSLAFIGAVVGRSAAKGIIAVGLGLLAASIGTGDALDGRLAMGNSVLAQGLPLTTVLLGVLVLGEVFHGLEQARSHAADPPPRRIAGKSGRLGAALRARIMPHIARSALIGTGIGALPGIGSTLAATLGYDVARKRHARQTSLSVTAFGRGAPEGVAATEAANSSVAGANLIPVLSLGIPGNAAAVFLILAADSIGSFTPGPGVFALPGTGLNPELVTVFGIFTLMMLANLMNWTIGGVFMRSVAPLGRLPRGYLLPVVTLLTLLAVYADTPRMWAIGLAIGFGVAGWAMRRIGMSPLPFIIAFLLGPRLEETARQAFSASGGDPLFLLKSPVAVVLLALALAVVVRQIAARRR